jgi:peptidoglycan/LPS O-acetylase OafA/YrhL
MLNTLLIVTPATVAFAWLFFQYCEKPYMKKRAGVGTGGRSRRQEQEEQQKHGKRNELGTPAVCLLPLPPSFLICVICG